MICSYFLSFMGYLKYLLLWIQRSPLTKEWKFFQNQGFAVRKKKTAKCNANHKYGW